MNRYSNIYFYSTINVIMYEATLVFVYQRKCTVLKFNYAFLKKDAEFRKRFNKYVYVGRTKESI